MHYRKGQYVTYTHTQGKETCKILKIVRNLNKDKNGSMSLLYQIRTEKKGIIWVTANNLSITLIN